jgi:hypothetical protein
MPIINIRNAALPPSARGLVAVGPLRVPRFWATIWSDVLNPRLEPSSRQKYLLAAPSSLQRTTALRFDEN